MRCWKLIRNFFTNFLFKLCLIFLIGNALLIRRTLPYLSCCSSIVPPGCMVDNRTRDLYTLRHKGKLTTEPGHTPITSVLNPDLIRIQSGKWIPIRIRNPDSDTEGQKLLHRNRKNVIFISAVNIFKIFGHQNPGSGLDPDPDRYLT
jgi:hypothetical protein